MKTVRHNGYLLARDTVTIATLLIASGIGAAPLTWFPGPPLFEPLSGAASVAVPGRGNVVIGGTSYYSGESFPESLIATNSYWSGMAPLYSVNISPGAVSSGDIILVYGGTDGTASMNAVYGYSTSGDTPPTFAPMSVARSYLGYAGDRNGNAYAIGGLDDFGQPLASAEKFNPDSGTSGAWSAIASLPSPRYNFPAVFDRTNQIYIFGGYSIPAAGAEISSVLRYSTSKNTWTNLASLPVAVAGSAAALGPDGKIYVVGGLSGGVATNVVQVFNPAANSWTLSTMLPENLSASAIGVDSLGRLLVIGGMDENGNDVADVWRTQPLSVPDSAPVFTQLPGTNASYLSVYNSSISATGNPPPTFQLLSGPAGMSVDLYTGAITWTPQGLSQIGSIPVAIEAANYAGSTNWSFTITVPNPPPTPVTNLTVVSVTANSVTLSWSPEDPVVGAVTYSAYLKHVLHDPRGSGETIWYTQIGSSTTQTSLTISGLTPGLTQAYYIVAVGPGGSSGYNSSIVATTWRVQPPANLHLTGLTSTSISLAWDPPSGPVPAASYEVWGWYNGGVNSTVYSTTDTTLTVSGLVPGSSHQWGVRAFDPQGYPSTFNYGFTVANPVPVPPQITGAILTAAGDGFHLTIAEGGSVLQTVLIQAATDPADPNSWVQIGSVFPTSNLFTFIDLNAAQYPARFYRVLAP